MFAARLICSWIGALGLAAGAFCQTYVQFSIDGGPIPRSINEKGEISVLRLTTLQRPCYRGCLIESARLRSQDCASRATGRQPQPVRMAGPIDIRYFEAAAFRPAEGSYWARNTSPDMYPRDEYEMKVLYCLARFGWTYQSSTSQERTRT